MKTKTNGLPFGKILASIRKTKGLTQSELGEKIQVPRYRINYYENQTERPPSYLLPELAKALRVSIDELMGFKPFKDHDLPKNIKMWRRLKKIEELPLRDQRLVFSTIEGLLAKKRERERTKTRRTA